MKKIIIFLSVVVGLWALVIMGQKLNIFGSSSELAAAVSDGQENNSSGQFQTVKIELSYRGYNPDVLIIKKGIPVRWIIDVKQMSGCTNSIILGGGYNINKDLQYGQNVIEFLPRQTGEIPFSCWMRMVRGKFIVTE